MKKSIDEIIKDKILFLKVVSNGDVAKYGLKERDYQGQLYSDKKGLMNFFEILSMTKPDVVSEVYERFLKAGVDIIVTNTAKANRYYLNKYGLSDIAYELNLEATKIARSKATKYSSIVRDKKRFLGGTLSNLPDEIDFETAESYYSEQIKALFAGKVDFIFLSEMEDEQSLKAALLLLGTEFLKNENYKILGFVNNFSPEFIKKYHKINFEK